MKKLLLILSLVSGLIWLVLLVNNIVIISSLYSLRPGLKFSDIPFLAVPGVGLIAAIGLGVFSKRTNRPGAALLGQLILCLLGAFFLLVVRASSAG